MRPLFNTALPLIQAPMAGVQDWRLAAAVCAAGGLGSVPAGMLDAAGLEQQLAQLSAATDTPWNVNFFCHDSPAPNPEGEQRWVETLHPYYDEFGADPKRLAMQVTEGDYGKSEVIAILSKEPLFDMRRPRDESVSSLAEALADTLQGREDQIIGVASRIIDARP